MTGASVIVGAHRVIVAHPPLPARTAAVPVHPMAAQTVHPATGSVSRETLGPASTSVRHADRSPVKAARPAATPPGFTPPTAAQPTAAQPSPQRTSPQQPSPHETSPHQTSPHQASVHHLLLRQMIPHHAAVVVPATADLIRRAPAAPPVGTPRRNTVRIPDSIAADLTAAGAAGRTRRPPPVPASVAPASTASTGPAASTVGAPAAVIGASRASLLDTVPVSLFERARAGLATSALPAGLHPAHPAGTASPGREPFAPNRPGSGTVRRFTGSGPTVSTRSAMTDIDTQAFAAPAVADALTPREWDELVDLIVDKLEDRVRDELARRGRRFSPGVF